MAIVPEPPTSAGVAVSKYENERPLDTVEQKRQRFEDAGRFPVKKAVAVAVVAVIVLFAGFMAYQQFFTAPEVGGAEVVSPLTYPSGQVQMVKLNSVQQGPQGIVVSLAEVKSNSIVGFDYERTSRLPDDFKVAAGGNVVPMLAYVAPSGRLVVATAFCEPCKSTVFHIEGANLVCNTCFTKWDLNTLEGVAGACTAYPPQEIVAQVEGDDVQIPTAPLEAWTPRGFGESN